MIRRLKLNFEANLWTLEVETLKEMCEMMMASILHTSVDSLHLNFNHFFLSDELGQCTE